MVPEINLLPKTNRKSAESKWVTLILALVFMLLLLFLAVQYVTLTNSLKTLEAEQQILATEKTDLETTLASLHEPQGVDLEESVAFVERVSYPVSPLIMEINHYLDDDAYLRDYSFSEENVQFAVDFETMSEVVSYIEYLTGSLYFEDTFVHQIEAFNPIPLGEEDEVSVFDNVDRYSNSFEVLIDLDYLRAGGAEK